MPLVVSKYFVDFLHIVLFGLWLRVRSGRGFHDFINKNRDCVCAHRVMFFRPSSHPVLHLTYPSPASPLMTADMLLLLVLLSLCYCCCCCPLCCSCQYVLSIVIVSTTVSNGTSNWLQVLLEPAKHRSRGSSKYEALFYCLRRCCFGQVSCEPLSCCGHELRAERRSLSPRRTRFHVLVGKFRTFSFLLFSGVR